MPSGNSTIMPATRNRHRSSWSLHSLTHTTLMSHDKNFGNSTITTRSTCHPLSINNVPEDAHSARIIRDIQADIFPPDEQSVLNARHAYYANVSYFDDQVGRFVDALKSTDLIDDTVVIVTADHGDMLGERGLWYKMNFFEQARANPTDCKRSRTSFSRELKPPVP